MQQVVEAVQGAFAGFGHLHPGGGGELYLLINRKEFMETADDREWETRIKRWLNSG